MNVIIFSDNWFIFFETPWTAAHQAPLPSLSHGVFSYSCPLNQWYYLIISSSETPFLLLPSIFPSIRAFSNESALYIRWPSIWASAPASVLPINIQDYFPFWLVSSPCHPRDSQESSPPQFKSINSSVLSLLYGSHIYTWLLGKS